ncbi:MAG: hypothetical protein HUK24_08215 [Sphaerochaetaceae bacterium]|nr:hypothetical protein [Sphaerochaetaceae bacterium]
MRKIFLTLLVLLVSFVAFAEVKTHSVIISYTVDAVEPEFVIQDIKTGETGKVINYLSKDIAKENVTGYFRIIQANNAKYCGSIAIDVKATELEASVNGTTYTTQGVSIYSDGMNFGSSMSFVLNYDGSSAPKDIVRAFAVLWKTNDSLVKASYSANVSISYTSV